MCSCELFALSLYRSPFRPSIVTCTQSPLSESLADTVGKMRCKNCGQNEDMLMPDLINAEDSKVGVQCCCEVKCRFACIFHFDGLNQPVIASLYLHFP